jgi:hypothetical protein
MKELEAITPSKASADVEKTRAFLFQLDLPPKPRDKDKYVAKRGTCPDGAFVSSMREACLFTHCNADAW